VPQRFLDHGSRADVLASVGLTAQDVARRVTEWTAALPVDGVARPLAARPSGNGAGARTEATGAERPARTRGE
jgi:hypothetical protein